MQDLADLEAFHAHEMMRDDDAREDARWSAWLHKAAKAIGGIDDLDGNQDTDGYSLDFAYDAYLRGDTVEQHVADIRLAIAALAQAGAI